MQPFLLRASRKSRLCSAWLRPVIWRRQGVPQPCSFDILRNADGFLTLLQPAYGRAETLGFTMFLQCGGGVDLAAKWIMRERAAVTLFAMSFPQRQLSPMLLRPVFGGCGAPVVSDVSATRLVLDVAATCGPGAGLRQRCFYKCSQRPSYQRCCNLYFRG